MRCPSCDGSAECPYCFGTGGPEDEPCEICESSGDCCECDHGQIPDSLEESLNRSLNNVERVRLGLTLNSFETRVDAALAREY